MRESASRRRFVCARYVGLLRLPGLRCTLRQLGLLRDAIWSRGERRETKRLFFVSSLAIPADQRVARAQFSTLRNYRW